MVEALIRPEEDADFDAIDALVEAAFGSPAEAQLVRDIRASERYRLDSSLVAELDGVVVGHVMISGADLVDTAATVEIAMLSPLAVAPTHHRQGIGGDLVRAVCAIADERGEPMVLLQGDPRYYSRFGFTAAAADGITMKLPDWAPLEAAQVLHLTGWNGTLRGALVEPPAFDALD